MAAPIDPRLFRGAVLRPDEAPLPVRFDPGLALMVVADAADKIETLQLTVLEVSGKAAQLVNRQNEEIERLKTEVRAAWADAAGWYRRAVAAETELAQRREFEDGQARRLALRGTLPATEPGPPDEGAERSRQFDALLTGVAQRLAIEEGKRRRP